MYYDPVHDRRYIYPVEHHRTERGAYYHDERGYPYHSEVQHHSPYYHDRPASGHHYGDHDSYYGGRDHHYYQASNDENDETYRRPKSLGQTRRFPDAFAAYSRRETELEREAREHYEFGEQWGAPAPYYPIPESHKRDPWDMHFDPYLVYEEAHSEKRPHWTDDDEGFSMDLLM